MQVESSAPAVATVDRLHRLRAQAPGPVTLTARAEGREATATVDARTVNDVKVSADGRTCVIGREGASDRKNGIVILDCAAPTDVSVITEYTNRLTGGVHNLFVYVASYNAGLRVVDLSGDLKGNLYEQGREIAHFKPFDPEGRIPNAPMTWGPQPYKGHIFFADWNSGL